VAVRHKGRQPRPLADRFWEKVYQRGPDECWPFLGSIDGRGYGSIGADGGKPLRRAHRVAYELVIGHIPPGMVVCHTCDHRECVNPRHLFVGTQRDNVLDMIRKGRRHSSAGERNPCVKLHADQVLAIRHDSRPAREILVAFGIAASTLYSIRNHETWRHLP
jgi:hypothetical protein